ncbi:hypothetical protein B0O80DRAFT_492068 [Mortierella sp. GBAus27b]|nr:hypothetical protein B0O80DRAFT_492068 [Mortierella sp. GBAus27b]
MATGEHTKSWFQLTLTGAIHKQLRSSNGAKMDEGYAGQLLTGPIVINSQIHPTRYSREPHRDDYSQ